MNNVDVDTLNKHKEYANDINFKRKLLKFR